MIGWVFGIVAVAVMIVGDVLRLHVLVSSAILVVALVLANGLLEKYVRHQAHKRRALGERITTQEPRD